MDALSDVNRTAYGVAAIRAAETRRAERLFDDPYAAELVADSLPRAAIGDAEREQRQRLVRHVILRTRFYDDLLLGAVRRQVVVLGAGLDARAWRLPWPAGTVLWELDQEAVLAGKAERLPPAPIDRRPVPVDLREDWPAALTAAGHDPAESTAWLAEGLLAYLETAEAERLLAAVTALSAAGSVLGVERSATARRLPDTVTDLFRGGLPGGAAATLTHLGWVTTETTAAELAAAYGRPELAAADSRLVRAERPPG